ncbi:MAG: hypothetical protein ACO1OO_09940 [Flavisolibacter sp.]
MKFTALQPFVPSGDQFDQSKKLFEELGFTATWDAGDYVGFERDGCRFILQRYNDRRFAENFMINVAVDDVEAFRQMVLEKKLTEKFNIRIGQVTQQPYGKEVNLIDLAGVCWHFVQ